MKELASLELFAVSELYVTHEPVPHPRKWVGLSGKEINHIFAANVGYPERMMKEVENLLKEKNT